MVYMLELRGKGTDRANEVIFHVCKSTIEAYLYSSNFTRLEDKYWTRFVIVEDATVIDNLYRDIWGATK